MDREDQKKLKGITGIGTFGENLDADYNQQDREAWQKSLQLASMAAKMKPMESLGFSLGRLIFANADKWFGGHGGRNKDGTKDGNAASAAGTTDKPEAPAINPEFAQNVGYNTNDPLGVNQMGYQGMTDPLTYAPAAGEFGSPEYAQQNGINIQQNTIAPTDNGQGVKETSTTLFAAPAGPNQGGLNTFNPQTYSIQENLNNMGSWQNQAKQNGMGYFGSMPDNGAADALVNEGLDEWWKRNGGVLGGL